MNQKRHKTVKTFKIIYDTTVSYVVRIEAENEEDAERKLFEEDTPEPVVYCRHGDTVIEITEVKS